MTRYFLIRSILTKVNVVLCLACVFFFLLSSALRAEEHHHDDEHAAHHADKHNEHDEHDEHDERGHGESGRTRIRDAMARKVGIVTARATARELQQVTTLYGEISSGPEQLSHVRARFEGLIVSVKVSIGDEVKTGDVLAEVESNESLKTYTLRAPISGLVVQRHANTGEVTRDQVLFSIADFNTVWAELRVFPVQQDLIKRGQPIQVVTAQKGEGGSGFSGRIEHLVPALDEPYLLARVKLENAQLSLIPGQMISAEVEVGRIYADLAVQKQAVQTLDGRLGVFVKHDDEYRFSPLVLGEADRHYIQVLSGLDAGVHYVSDNSYLIKADIEKSEAEHEH